MKLGVLFSGGKDSTLALLKAMEQDDVVCLITVISRNKESYMFHTPNIELTQLQAEAIGLPLISQITEGEKEKELVELKKVILEAKKKYRIDAIVTGAIESVYQSERIKKICDELGLGCINPLWKRDQVGILRELVENNFEVIITGIFAYPIKKDLLGRKFDEGLIKELIMLRDKYKISPSGEGGEIETAVLDAPFFRKKIVIDDTYIEGKENSAALIIKRARLNEK